MPPPAAAAPPAGPPPAANRQGSGSGVLKALAIVAGAMLLLVVGCAVLIGGPANEVAQEADESSTTGGTSVGVGEPLLLEGTQYRVTGATTSASVGNEFLNEQAPTGTTFVIVELELTNKKSDTRTFTTEAAKLITSNGNQYSVDTDASVAAAGEGSTLILEEMQPDVPERGKVIYAVPAGQVRGARLRVEDLFGGGHGFIELGL